MTNRRWAFCSIVLLLIIGTCIFAWYQRQHLIDATFRPWLCSLLSERLDGNVQIERIEIDSDRIVLTRVHYLQGVNSEYSFPRTELSFSPWQLLGGQLSSVKLVRPQVSITCWPESSQSSSPPFPARPWLDIKSVTIEDGNLALPLQAKVLRVSQLNLTAGMSPAFPFEITGLVGVDSLLPLAIRGKGEWEDWPTLTIESLEFDGNPLLAHPVTLSSRLEGGLASLGLDRLDAAMVVKVLKVMGQPSPWPAESDWGLNEPQFEISWRNGQVRGNAQARDGFARLGENRVDLSGFTMTLTGEKSTWRLKTAIKLPGESQFEVDSTLENDQMKGTWRFNSRYPERLNNELAERLTTLAKPHELSLNGKILWDNANISIPSLQLLCKLDDSGWKGDVQAKASIKQSGESWGISLDDLRVDNLEYFSADGLSGLTGGKFRLTGNVNIDTTISYEVSGEISLAEALLGNWYGEIADLPLHFNLKGDRTDAGPWTLSRGIISLAQLLTADLTAETDFRSGRLSGNVEVAELGDEFTSQVKKHGDFAIPGLNDLTMAGLLKAEGDLRWSQANLNLDIEVKLQRGDLRLGSDLEIRNIDATVPLTIQKPIRPTAKNTTGRLTWDSFDAGPLQSQKIDIILSSSPNQLQLQEMLPLKLAGGELNLSDVTLDWDDTLSFITSARLSGVKLGTLSEELDWPPLNGLLEAELRGIRFSNDQLSLDGGASANLFGGRVELSNMSVRSPFAEHPLYRLDVDFSGIDLLQLTSAFEFGEMNGIADGYIHHLELFGTTPSTFQARFETRTSGTRNISVKALNNINTLSQGGLSSALSQGIYQFIDFYRYRKIGLLCSLKNDLFQVQGTVRETDPRYLIEGSLLPPRIDVLVTSPAISFQEMVRRLKRIERTER